MNSVLPNPRKQCFSSFGKTDFLISILFVWYFNFCAFYVWFFYEQSVFTISFFPPELTFSDRIQFTVKFSYSFFQVEHICFSNNKVEPLEKTVKMFENGPQNLENYIFQNWKWNILSSLWYYSKQFKIVLCNDPKTSFKRFVGSKINFNTSYHNMTSGPKDDQSYLIKNQNKVYDHS